MTDVQFYFVIVIILMAIGYAGWRIFEVLKPGGDPCQNCEMKKNCKKFGQSKEK